MPLPIAVQLYSVRDQLSHDFDGVVRRIAAMGYAGVETAGFAGTTPAVAAGIFRDLGLTVCSAHVPLPTRQNEAEVFETLARLSCSRAVCAWMPAERFRTVSDIRKVCDELNAAAQLAAGHDVTLYYHNHWWELHLVDGKPALWHMVDALDPSIQFEIDTYWARTGGVDPAELLRQLGQRASLLHIKDGPCTEKDPMVAVGDGAMDFPAILRAAGGHPLWAIVELDRCATDMLEAVEASHVYLSGILKAEAL